MNRATQLMEPLLFLTFVSVVMLAATPPIIVIFQKTNAKMRPRPLGLKLATQPTGLHPIPMLVCVVPQCATLLPRQACIASPPPLLVAVKMARIKTTMLVRVVFRGATTTKCPKQHAKNVQQAPIPTKLD